MAMRTTKGRRPQRSNGANLGFEEKLWQAADKLRGHMDAAEYKHVVLGLIFLKYISDAFQERHEQLESLTRDPASDYFIKEPEARYEVLANPPFNMSDWGGERLRDDVRWRYGVPPVGNANYAWVQHIIHHLSPTGIAGFVLANGSMSSNQSGEGEIRKNIIEADLVDCMIALPAQLFYGSQIPACLWFLARDKGNSKFRDRRRQTLFIDARKMGYMVDRVHRELGDEEIVRIAGTYHAWRGEAGEYKDIPGFCRSATTEEIASHGYVLTPGRYVGAEEIEDDGEPFEQKMRRLTAQLYEHFEESRRLEDEIRKNLKVLGYGGYCQNLYEKVP